MQFESLKIQTYKYISNEIKLKSHFVYLRWKKNKLKKKLIY